MGKTNSKIFPIYRQKALELGITDEDHVAAFGCTEQPTWLDNHCDLYDEQLGNWEINSLFPQEENQYDAIVCTRVAYFAKDPLKLMAQFHRLLKPDGRLLIDWGLGDHWRYNDFHIGWNHKTGMMEEAYGNRLHSAIWREGLDETREVIAFRKNCIKFGYDLETPMMDILKKEVDCVRDVSEFLPMLNHCKVATRSFWPDAPQLYMIMSAVVEK